MKNQLNYKYYTNEVRNFFIYLATIQSHPYLSICFYQYNICLHLHKSFPNRCWFMHFLTPTRYWVNLLNLLNLSRNLLPHIRSDFLACFWNNCRIITISDTRMNELVSFKTGLLFKTIWGLAEIIVILFIIFVLLWPQWNRLLSTFPRSFPCSQF